MIGTATAGSRLRNPDKFYIAGEWVEPSSDATIEVIDSNDEQPFLRVAKATAADMERAVGAARDAFDRGEWRRLGHLERAGYLRAMGAALRARSDTLADILPRESGMLFAHSQKSGGEASWLLDYYADLAADYPWEEPAPTVGALGGPSLSLAQFGLIVREPVGVAAAIVAWNGPVRGALMKIARHAGRLHRSSEGVTGGARRCLPHRRGGRGRRPAAWCPQRGHGRPRGLRAARA